MKPPNNILTKSVVNDSTTNSIRNYVLFQWSTVAGCRYSVGYWYVTSLWATEDSQSKFSEYRHVRMTFIILVIIINFFITSGYHFYHHYYHYVMSSLSPPLFLPTPPSLSYYQYHYRHHHKHTRVITFNTIITNITTITTIVAIIHTQKRHRLDTCCGNFTLNRYNIIWYILLAWYNLPGTFVPTKCIPFVLHCADICHPAKEWSVHKKWTDRVMEEFFEQV